MIIFAIPNTLYNRIIMRKIMLGVALAMATMVGVSAQDATAT